MKKILTKGISTILWVIIVVSFLIAFPFIWLFFRKQLRKFDEEINNLHNSC